MSDAARKRTLADWVVKTKKQVVKLYAVSKWSRDADTVQKCMVSVKFKLSRHHAECTYCIQEHHRFSYGSKSTIRRCHNWIELLEGKLGSCEVSVHNNRARDGIPDTTHRVD
jgi:hypothetical protein